MPSILFAPPWRALQPLVLRTGQSVSEVLASMASGSRDHLVSATEGLIQSVLLALTFSVGIAHGSNPAPLPPQAFPSPTRPVAPVVSPTWGDHGQRDRDQEVSQITARLRIRAGMTVADIGAGSGYDTVRLAPVVGPGGRVIAEDVTPAYLNLLRRTLAQTRIGNVDIVRGSTADPRLARGSIDRAIMVHMYHEIAQPYGLLARLAPAFKPGGLLGIEELDRATALHGTPPALLRCELEASGYHLVALNPLKGSLGYFAVFSPPKPGWRPSMTLNCHD